MKKFTKKQKNELMGKVVEVNFIYKKFQSNNNIFYKEIKIKNRIAWITGFSYVKEGYISEYKKNDFNNFNTFKTISCVKIKFSYKEKEKHIPLNGFILSEGIPCSEYDEFASETMKSEYKNFPNSFPRDSKGRFIEC